MSGATVPLQIFRVAQGAASATAAAHQFISPAITAPGGAHLFVSDGKNNVVDIYNVAGELTGTLTGFSFGYHSTQSENLAVDMSLPRFSGQ